MDAFTLMLLIFAYVLLGFVFRIGYIAWCLCTQSYPALTEAVTYIGPAVFMAAFWFTQNVLYGG